MLKVDPIERPNVEDLLNLPYVSMRLRDKALRKNMLHMRKKEEEVGKKEAECLERQSRVKDRELELEA